ncbi:hypothetical protein RHMOL_Rhmol08G0131600 [Rhododendron molle]|uniref:Uncharacterized protein n=1 Tax=Rhododendron molle TaxID=49168 RepID=A0ACC0MP32_RHOML|nr:hypothetical protein RHMOL_Rhmol08G0131600 [Rhododendron molle]
MNSRQRKPNSTKTRLKWLSRGAAAAPRLRSLRSGLGEDGRWVNALMRIQEWTEIVADPRWKTFILRYNRRNKGGNGGRVVWHGKFQSDPLSYTLNFDEGENNGDLDEEENVIRGNLLMQYAAIPPGVD